MILVVKVAVPEDFSTELHPLKVETIALKRSTTSNQPNKNGIPPVFLPRLFFGGRSGTGITSNKQAFEASKKIVSKNSELWIVLHYRDDFT